MQDGQPATIEALERGDLRAAPVTDKERVLLELVEILTRCAYETTDADVERLRSVGWTDAQIAETVYVTAMFAFFNRVADAFGLKDPCYRDLAAGGKVEGLPQQDMTGASPPASPDSAHPGTAEV